MLPTAETSPDAFASLGMGGNPLGLVMVLVGITLIPFLLMTCTSFLKFSVVLSIVRTALGTQQMPPNMVILGLSGVLSLYVMAPVGLETRQALEHDLRSRGVETPGAADLVRSLPSSLEPLRLFLERHAHDDDVAVFLTLAERRAALQQAALGDASLEGASPGPPMTPAPAPAAQEKTNDPFASFDRHRRPALPSSGRSTAAPDPYVETGSDEKPEVLPVRRPDRRDLLVLMPAFMISELAEAFTIGFLIFLPFLVVDLVVANILLAMGMHMLSPVVVSLPFKLLLFVMVDGWRMITEGLLQPYLI